MKNNLKKKIAFMLSILAISSSLAVTASAIQLGGGVSRDVLNKSDFCDKRLKYKGFYRKNNLKSEFP